jgi:PKHD-type hydroxylase
MILCMGNVLTLDDLDQVTTALQKAEFVDGKLTAGWHARLVKHNLQAQDSETSRSLKQCLVDAIWRNALFQMAVRPKVLRSPLLSRYEPGMSYGTHVDNALMGDPNPMRSDVSLTLFLSSPDEYDGGELVIEDSLGERPFKLDAGSMIIYPSTTLHRVEPVTRGVRLVAVSWVQSYVRDPGDREILFELDTARKALFEQYGKTPEFDLISKSHANLLRKWVEV